MDKSLILRQKEVSIQDLSTIFNNLENKIGELI